MRRWDDGDMFIIEQLLLPQPVVVGFVVHDRKIELRIEQRGERVERVLRGNLQRKSRVATPQAFDESGEPGIAGVAMGADPQFAGRT